VFRYNKSNRIDDKCCCVEFFVLSVLIVIHFNACINCCHLCDVKTTLVQFSIVFVLVTLCFYRIVTLPVFDSQHA
jgi:hypothetical protein